MSESQGMLRASGGELPPTPDDGDGAAATSIGGYLKRQRLLRGITIEDLAADTRIPLRSLERLEAGYFDGVTDGFVRGFVRTVATALGLDADQTVARMLDEPVARRWDRDGVGLWRKQLLALVALVAATAIAVLVLRAGWNLLVGGGSARGREVVLWRDPVHQLARDVAEGRFVVPPPAPEPPPEPEPVSVPAVDLAPESQPVPVPMPVREPTPEPPPTPALAPAPEPVTPLESVAPPEPVPASTPEPAVPTWTEGEAAPPVTIPDPASGPAGAVGGPA
ncbi:MAG: helix-turn-helix transcriptional regulator [Myxococcota bacterium]